jgi:hypothetical protein
MEQEATRELDCIESHNAAALVVSGVSPAEAHLAVFKAEQSSVGDGDPVGVAGQVLQHMFGFSEGRLGVDHPLSWPQGAKQGVPATSRGQRLAHMDCRFCLLEYEGAGAKSVREHAGQQNCQYALVYRLVCGSNPLILSGGAL